MSDIDTTSKEFIQNIAKARKEFIQYTIENYASKKLQYIGEINPKDIPQEAQRRYKLCSEGDEIKIEHHLFETDNIHLIIQWRVRG